MSDYIVQMTANDIRRLVDQGEVHLGATVALFASRLVRQVRGGTVLVRIDFPGETGGGGFMIRARTARWWMRALWSIAGKPLALWCG